MRNAVTFGDTPSAASAHSALGEARFERFDATSAELQLEYHISGLDAALADGSDAALAEGVADVCQTGNPAHAGNAAGIGPRACRTVERGSAKPR